MHREYLVLDRSLPKDLPQALDMLGFRSIQLQINTNALKAEDLPSIFLGRVFVSDKSCSERFAHWCCGFINLEEIMQLPAKRIAECLSNAHIRYGLGHKHTSDLFSLVVCETDSALQLS